MIAETSTSIHAWYNSQSLCVIVRSRTDEKPTGESRRRTIHQPPQSPSKKVSAGRTPFSIALNMSAKNKSSNTAKALVYVCWIIETLSGVDALVRDTLVLCMEVVETNGASFIHHLVCFHYCSASNRLHCIARRLRLCDASQSFILFSCPVQLMVQPLIV